MRLRLRRQPVQGKMDKFRWCARGAGVCLKENGVCSHLWWREGVVGRQRLRGPECTYERIGSHPSRQSWSPGGFIPLAQDRWDQSSPGLHGVRGATRVVAGILYRKGAESKADCHPRENCCLARCGPPPPRLWSIRQHPLHSSRIKSGDLW